MGISATHEEYREAKDRCRVLAFVLRDAEREELQQRFVEEVRDWAGGVLHWEFASPDELRDAVTRALHDVELEERTGPLDEGEMVERAQALIPERYGFQVATLCLATTCGPRQQALRPAQLEDPALGRDLHREILLGDDAVFERTEGVQTRIEGEAYPGSTASLPACRFLGSVRLTWPATGAGVAALPALIEEDLGDQLSRSLRLTAWILDRIDPVRRLSHVAPTIGVLVGRLRGLADARGAG